MKGIIFLQKFYNFMECSAGSRPNRDNLNAKSLQVYDGAKWNDIYSGSDNGLSATGAVGTLSVSTNGAISIDL